MRKQITYNVPNYMRADNTFNMTFATLIRRLYNLTKQVFVEEGMPEFFKHKLVLFCLCL